MKYDNQKILITNHFLKEFSGSEIAVYDVAKEFITLGFKVTLGSFTFVSPLKDLFDELDCNFIDLNKIDDSYDDKFDIIWAQHFTTIDKILLETKISSNFIIYSSLSPYEALESPPLSSQKINLFLANSFETRDKLLDMGLSSESIYLLPNPVSDDFFRKNINSLDKLERIAIVSNHIPDEIRKAISYLKNDNIDVVLYGIEGVFELITPNILEQYDAVITIGRTVQYCLSMGIPVYCYDRFGGCGWITSTNIEEASKFNFSGRCTNRKLNVNEIIKEIKENFNIAKSNIDSNRKFAEENYKLKYHLSYILNYINSSSVNYNIDFFRNVALRQKKYIEHLIKSNFFIQLFVSQDTHFTEENSIKYPVLQTTEIQRFEFDLKDFGNIKNLRLDPLNDSCVVNISKIYLVLEDDLQIDLKLNIQANASSHHGDSYFFEFLDPNIYFEGVDFESLSIKKFIVELIYNYIAKDAVHTCANQIAMDKNYIIENQKQELEEKEQQIQNQKQELEEKEQQIQNQKQELEEKEQQIQNQKQELEEKEQQIQNQKQELEEKEQQIQNQKQELEEKEQQIQNQKQELEEKEQQIQNQKQELEEKEQQIQNQKQELEEKEQQIQNQKQELEEKEQQIQNQKQELEEKEQQIQNQKQELEEKEQQIQNQKQELEEKEQQIQNQKQELEEKEQQIQNQKQELETKEQSIKNLNDELISIYMSKSWKITRPLRSLIRKIRKGK